MPLELFNDSFGEPSQFVFKFLRGFNHSIAPFGTKENRIITKRAIEFDVPHLDHGVFEPDNLDTFGSHGLNDPAFLRNCCIGNELGQYGSVPKSSQQSIQKPNLVGAENKRKPNMLLPSFCSGLSPFTFVLKIRQIYIVRANTGQATIQALRNADAGKSILFPIESVFRHSQLNVVWRLACIRD